ncbi:MAG: mechanosensitive ion channel family protein [Tepidisphaeraceae bacterium]
MLLALVAATQPADAKGLTIFGIRLVGINPENGQKLLLTAILLAIVVALNYGIRWLLSVIISGDRLKRGRFWTRQGVSLFMALVVVLGIMSIWFDDPTRLTTAVGLVTAGLAFALQKVVTSLAGYFVILRGNTFTVGDRISMGGVRGDVVALGFTQTTIMEMGQPPAVQSAEPAMWVKSRQFTGRIVTVSNSTVFDTPVFNYTREFPFIYEEMTIWIAYRDDHAKAEQVLLDAARKHQVDINELSAEASHRLSNKYGVMKADFEPRVYYRLTDNWVDLTVRFIARDHGVRDVKDAMSREVLARLTEAGIGMASSTIELTGLPPLQIQRTAPNA